jgi:GT2 family glycosyltransferase
LELIVVDDHSEQDDSVEVVVAWAKQNKARFNRVCVHSHRENQGPAEARNTAFRLARGEYVFIVDADNEIYPRAIAALQEAAQSGGFDATYSQIEKFGSESSIGSADIWNEDEMFQANYVDVMSLVRRDAWEKVGGFSQIDDGWEDYDFWLKFIDAGLTAAYLPEILCRYRVHDRSRTATQAHAAHEDLRNLMAFRHPRFGGRRPEPSALAARPDELPPAVLETLVIQGLQLYIDRICETPISDVAKGVFELADDFRLEGWTFIPEIGQSGRVWVALVEDKGSQAVFLPAERIGREDVARTFQDAPILAGFQARAPLRDACSDGQYLVGLVNSVGDRAAFQLTSLSIRLFEGRVVEAKIVDVDDTDVAAAFALVVPGESSV